MKTMKKLFLAVAVIMMGLTAMTFTSCSKDEIQTGLAGTEWKGRTSEYIYQFTFEESDAWVSWSAYEGAYITTVKAYYSESDNRVVLQRQGSSLYYEGVIDGNIIHIHDIPNNERFDLYKVTDKNK